MITAARIAGFNCGYSGTAGLNTFLRDKEKEHNVCEDNFKTAGERMEND